MCVCFVRTVKARHTVPTHSISGSEQIPPLPPTPHQVGKQNHVLISYAICPYLMGMLNALQTQTKYYISFILFHIIIIIDVLMVRSIFYAMLSLSLSISLRA